MNQIGDAISTQPKTLSSEVDRDTVFDSFQRQLDEMTMFVHDEVARARRLADYLVGPQPEADNARESGGSSDCAVGKVQSKLTLLHSAISDLARQHQRLSDMDVFPG